jgi:positive regulator of sigma E activity
MNETAVICEVKDKSIRATISRDCSESCLHCTKPKHKGSILVHNSSGLEVKAGDMVEIYAPPGKTILAGFLIFIVPLLLFIVFYFLGKAITGTEDDLIPFLCGIGGIGAGFLLNVMIKHIRNQKDLPEIIKIYTEHNKNN